MTYFVIGLCLGMIVMAVISDKVHREELNELHKKNSTSMKPRLTEQVFAETKREKMLKDERIAWQAEHPKPWYLVKQS